MITILIKTFLRPNVVKRLLASIEKYYPDVKVIVLDDPDDMGVSEGRNRLVDMCETEYCLILDDDCIITDKTDLYRAVKELQEKDLDIIQFATQNDYERDYQGIFKTEDGVVTYMKDGRDGLYDFCLNVFIARTESLRRCRWNPKYKMGEHFGYFYTHRGKLKIGVNKENIIEHLHENNEDYQPYRARALDYVREYMKENGLKRRIDLGGVIIDV